MEDNCRSDAKIPVSVRIQNWIDEVFGLNADEKFAVSKFEEYENMFNQSHFIDITVRINGEDKHVEGDFLKHVTSILRKENVIK